MAANQEQAPLLALGGGGEIKETSSASNTIGGAAAAVGNGGGGSNVVVLSHDDDFEVRPSVNQQLFFQLNASAAAASSLSAGGGAAHHSSHVAVAPAPLQPSSVTPLTTISTSHAAASSSSSLGHGHTPVMASLQPLSIPPTPSPSLAVISPAHHSASGAISPTPSAVGASHIAISVNVTPPSTSEGTGYTQLQSPTATGPAAAAGAAGDNNKEGFKVIVAAANNARIAFNKLDRKKDGRLADTDIGAALVAVGCTVPQQQVKAFVHGWSSLLTQSTNQCIHLCMVCMIALDVRGMGGIHYDEFLKVRSVLNAKPLEDKNIGGINHTLTASIGTNDSDDIKEERWVSYPTKITFSVDPFVLISYADTIHTIHIIFWLH
jgi:hypothetical protein